MKGRIYAIKSKETDKIYVGSTVELLGSRHSKHKYDLKRFHNGKYHYVTSFDILQYEDAFIELIEEYECDNITQLREREGFHIKSMNCVNKCVSGRTRTQYNKDNRARILESQKNYYQLNKDKISEKKRKTKKL